MQVDLFMEHITQENFRAASDWSGNVWSVSCCVINFHLERPGDDVVLPADDRGFILRAEEGGGLFWDPDSNAVYRVDDEAYHAMVELGRGLGAEQTARMVGVSPDAVRELVTTLDSIRRTAEPPGSGPTAR